ncbi:PLVAP protein, partial [Upupa epops]|nr:PLVAP protein [Upupa epops]
MEKSGYTVAKFGLESKEAMPKRDCSFYVKYIFLFTSLIQFLIILGLVLFMVYGNAQAGTDSHLRQLEEQLQDRYNKIIALGARNINLTHSLNATLKEKQGLQVLLQKVQKDLDKCNSSQGLNPVPQVSGGLWGGRGDAPPSHKHTAPFLSTTPEELGCPPAALRAERVVLQSQLDKSTQQKKELTDNCSRARAELLEASQKQESCQQDLVSTKQLLQSSRINQELLQQECRSLRSDVSYSFQRIKEQGLFLWQQERDTKYVGRSVCDMSLLQCQHNCSREKQELQKRLQEAEKRSRDGQEERRRMLEEKEQLGRELEGKRKAVAQAEGFKEQ